MIKKYQFTQAQITKLMRIILMAVHLAALLWLAPLNPVHIGCALVLCAIIIDIVFVNLGSITPAMLAGIGTGMAGVVKHLSVGVNIVFPLMLAVFSMIYLVWGKLSKNNCNQRRLSK